LLVLFKGAQLDEDQSEAPLKLFTSCNACMNNIWFDLGEGMLEVVESRDCVFGLAGLRAESIDFDFGLCCFVTRWFVGNILSLVVDSSDVDVSLE